jgi:hypothetical protein
VVDNLSLVAHARAAEMGGEQRVGPQILIAGESDVDQKGVALHARHHLQPELEAFVAVNHSNRRDARCEQFDGVLPQPLDFDPEPKSRICGISTRG